MKKILLVMLVLFLSVFSFSAVMAAQKGEFRIGNGAEPESIDPSLQQGVLEHRIHIALFENLTTVDPKDASPQPALAKSWDISKDGKTYTFHLRKTTWSDGVPITAQTVVKSWLRTLDPKTAAPYAWFPAMFIAGAEAFNAGKNTDPNSVKIKAIDDLTLQMEMVGPLPYVLGALEHPAFSLIPMHAVEKYGKDWTLPGNMVSNGPFMLESWRPQDKLTLVPNPKYWDKDKVKLARIIYYPIDDNNTAHKMFLNNELDWTDIIPRDQIEAALERDDSYNSPYLGTYYYVFQNEKKPFNDPRVRKALTMAVNRKDLTKKVTKAGEIPTYVIVPPMAGYKNILGNKEDLERAKKLLAEAGFPGGKGFPKFEIIYNTSESHKKIGEYIQQQWKENLGIECTLANQEWKTYLSNLNAGNFEVIRRGWIGDYQDPNTFLDQFITGGGMNGGKYSNPEYDKLIKQAASGMDKNGKLLKPADRMALLAKAEDIFITQDQGIMPIYHYTNLGMINKKVVGWYTNIVNLHPLKEVYIK
ncbi:MAG: peptide ABC transporter substrate-binding protein [Desulfobacteraceae bacterium]|nr:MAG: peptide ABC transporter substrate-binding protein [Desulfobacteraceae bacterium]